MRVPIRWEQAAAVKRETNGSRCADEDVIAACDGILATGQNGPQCEAGDDLRVG
jgi:hypothetical protein